MQHNRNFSRPQIQVRLSCSDCNFHGTMWYDMVPTTCPMCFSPRLKARAVSWDIHDPNDEESSIVETVVRRNSHLLEWLVTNTGWNKTNDDEFTVTLVPKSGFTEPGEILTWPTPVSNTRGCNGESCQEFVPWDMPAFVIDGDWYCSPDCAHEAIATLSSPPRILRLHDPQDGVPENNVHFDFLIIEHSLARGVTSLEDARESVEKLNKMYEGEISPGI